MLHPSRLHPKVSGSPSARLGLGGFAAVPRPGQGWSGWGVLPRTASAASCAPAWPPLRAAGSTQPHSPGCSLLPFLPLDSLILGGVWLVWVGREFWGREAAGIVLEKGMGRLRCPSLGPHLPCAEGAAGGASSHASPQHHCCCPPSPSWAPQHPTASCSHLWGARLVIGGGGQALGSFLGAGGSGQGPAEGLLQRHGRARSRPAQNHACLTRTRGRRTLCPCKKESRGWFGLSASPQRRQRRLTSGFDQRRNVCSQLCPARAAWASLPRGCPGLGGQQPPSTLQQRWGNPILLVRPVLPS